MRSHALSSKSAIRPALVFALASACGEVTRSNSRAEGGTPSSSSSVSPEAGGNGSSASATATDGGTTHADGGACVGPDEDAGNVPRSVVTLASGQQSPAEVVVDSISVYWTNSASLAPNARQGSVAKVAIAGGSTTTLASAQFAPWGIAVDATSVYWATEDGVRSMPLGGGEMISVDPTASAWLSLSGPTLYWTGISADQLQNVQTSATTGGTPITIASEQAGSALAQDFDGASGLAVGRDALYWSLAGTDQADTADEPEGALMRVGLEGGGTTTLYQSKNQPGAIALDAENAYWVTDGTFSGNTSSGLVLKSPLGGGTITTLASGLQNSSARGIAVDASYVYWTNSDSGTVMKVPLCGGRTTTLASGQTHPAAIAVDATSVYWANSGATGSDGQIMKVTPK